MGFIFKPLSRLLGVSKPKAQPRQEDPAESLQVEETKKKKARQAALSSLNPTGTTGAGTPQTTSRKTTGV